MKTTTGSPIIDLLGRISQQIFHPRIACEMLRAFFIYTKLRKTNILTIVLFNIKTMEINKFLFNSEGTNRYNVVYNVHVVNVMG